MPTIRSARVSKAVGKARTSARTPQWRKALVDGYLESQYQMVKPIRQLPELSNTTPIPSKHSPTLNPSTWSESVRIDRHNGHRNRNLGRRALAIFSPHKTQGLPTSSIPNLHLQSSAELQLYEHSLDQFDRYLKQHDRLTILRHVRANDRGKVRTLLRAQASYIDPSQISLNKVLGLCTIKNWLREVGTDATRRIPEIAVPIVKSFLKAFQSKLQIFRAKQRDSSSEHFDFNPTPQVSKPSSKRQRPSQFDDDLVHREYKRTCIENASRSMQQRAADPEFVPSDYDRSFSLSVCGPEGDESIESKEPSSGYPALNAAEGEGMSVSLEACHLDTPQTVDVPAKPVTPGPTSQSGTEANSLPHRNQSIKSSSNDAKIVQISNSDSTVSPGSPPNPQSILGKRKINKRTIHPLDIVRSNLDLVPMEHHVLINQMISECKGSDLEDDGCLQSIENCPSLIELLTNDSYGFNFTGGIFHFRELSAQERRTWYRRLWREATKKPLAFRDTLTTMFMNGLHPQDCFPRDSTWIQHFFEESEPRLDNKRIDDRHAWYDLQCKMTKPAALELPCEEDEQLVEKFMEESSLDILQKVMQDWLDVYSDELLAERIQHFRHAMTEAYLCESESNKELQELIQWLDGCQMGHEDTHNNPAQASRREIFEGALEKLLWYRYPRSSKWNANAELLLESYNERDDDDDDWLVDNKIPGREPK